MRVTSAEITAVTAVIGVISTVIGVVGAVMGGITVDTVVIISTPTSSKQHISLQHNHSPPLLLTPPKGSPKGSPKGIHLKNNFLATAIPPVRIDLLRLSSEGQRLRSSGRARGRGGGEGHSGDGYSPKDHPPKKYEEMFVSTWYVRVNTGGAE